MGIGDRCLALRFVAFRCVGLRLVRSSHMLDAVAQPHVPTNRHEYQEPFVEPRRTTSSRWSGKEEEKKKRRKE